MYKSQSSRRRIFHCLKTASLMVLFHSSLEGGYSKSSKGCLSPYFISVLLNNRYWYLKTSIFLHDSTSLFRTPRDHKRNELRLIDCNSHKKLQMTYCNIFLIEGCLTSFIKFIMQIRGKMWRIRKYPHETTHLTDVSCNLPHGTLPTLSL